MSEMEHKKGKLKEVLRYGEPVNIQDWLEMEWSVYIDQGLSQGAAYEVLQDFFEEQDWSCSYYLFDDKLYELIEVRTLDEYGYVEANFTTDGIEVDAFWYNGGGSWGECVTEALKELENKL